jgi:hypothetical protein
MPDVFISGHHPHVQGLVEEDRILLPESLQDGIRIVPVKIRIFQTNEFG